MRPDLALLHLAVCCRIASATVRTFGSPTVTSWPSARIVLGDPPSVIFNHTVSSDAQWACMDHFWITANSDLAMAAMGARLEVRYQFDGEVTPSVSFEPAMMSGNGWAAVPLAGHWMDGASEAGQEGIYAAGDKVGRGGRLTGWFNNLRMPFRHSVLVTAALVPRPGSAPPNISASDRQEAGFDPPPANPPDPPYPPGPVPSPHCKTLPSPADSHCVNADIIVRGFEDTTSSNAALILPSGLTLPRTARMRLHHFVSQTSCVSTSAFMAASNQYLWPSTGNVEFAPSSSFRRRMSSVATSLRRSRTSPLGMKACCLAYL
jgi:hypothetical protein